jgi:hypothetical protein
MFVDVKLIIDLAPPRIPTKVLELLYPIWLRFLTSKQDSISKFKDIYVRVRGSYLSTSLTKLLESVSFDQGQDLPKASSSLELLLNAFSKLSETEKSIIDAIVKPPIFQLELLSSALADSVSQINDVRRALDSSMRAKPRTLVKPLSIMDASRTCLSRVSLKHVPEDISSCIGNQLIDLGNEAERLGKILLRTKAALAFGENFYSFVDDSNRPTKLREVVDQISDVCL